MPDVSLSSMLLLNTLSIKVEDCSVNLVGNCYQLRTLYKETNAVESG